MNSFRSPMTCQTRPQAGDVPTVPHSTVLHKENANGVLYYNEKGVKVLCVWINGEINWGGVLDDNVASVIEYIVDDRLLRRRKKKKSVVTIVEVNVVLWRKGWNRYSSEYLNGAYCSGILSECSCLL